MSDTPPTVTVVIATYNRSQVVRHAIRSVINSTYSSWELLVVGDGCTDDTAACVASFGDSRIRFVNLPARTGEQSEPNNVGISMARGRYIAMLNHDDLYLPHQLAACVEELERGGADFVWTAAILAMPRAHPLADTRPCGFSLRGIPSRTGYSPFEFSPTSTWVFRRTMVEKAGPWLPSRRTFVTPSQAWLFGARRAGAVMQFVPRAGVVVVFAGARAGCYAVRESPDHEWLSRWMADEPRHLEIMLEEAAVSAQIDRLTLAYHAPGGAVRRLLLKPLHWAQAAFGAHPRSFIAAVVTRGRRGGLIDSHRRTTGA